jgi:Xaa-Pro aminopeptidase
MTAFERIDFDELRAALREINADGWLIYDFHGINPVAPRLVDYRSMVTRRLFVWLPAAGPPTSIVHTIDAGGVGQLPGEVLLYTTWQELHERLEQTLSGKRAAMEVSPQNAVPYLDRVPAGVIELLAKYGVSVVPSDRLVTRFASCWSSEELAAHRKAAEALAHIARNTLGSVVNEVGKATEYGVQQRVLEAMTSAGLTTEDPPIVAFGANAADPHHTPREADGRVLQQDEVVLLDLWGFPSHSAWADQTWMGYSGPNPPADVVSVWEAVRDARDAVVARLEQAQSTGESLTGGSLDDVARGVLRERGYAEAFGHRTGHSIDSDLHGSGPHLDNFETDDIRTLVPGVVFSVEPGVYLAGQFGVRSEINVALTDRGPEVTPGRPQTELILAT